jgi:hypothetical protein
VSGDDHEPVTSPDQHRPTVSPRAARFGAIVTILLLLAMTIGNKVGHVQDVYLVGTAALLALILVVDWVLRRNGLRS